MGSKKEKAKPASWRMFQRHRALVRAKAKQVGESEAEIVRRSIEAYCK